MTTRKKRPTDFGVDAGPGPRIASAIGRRPRADHFVLKVFVDLPDQERGVTVPLRLSRGDVDQCMKAMTAWLSRQSG